MFCGILYDPGPPWVLCAHPRKPHFMGGVSGKQVRRRKNENNGNCLARERGDSMANNIIMMTCYLIMYDHP